MKLSFSSIYEPIAPKLKETFARVLQEGRFIDGEDINRLERKLAAYLGAEEVVACKSGTHALMLALLASGVSKTDSVITIGTTYYATARAIRNVQAECVFCECKKDEGYLDEDACIQLIDKKVAAVIPVHLYGYAHEYKKLRAICKDREIAFIEDCSHAFGSSVCGKYVGADSEYACFSLYPTKNLGAFGDAGFVATNSKENATRMRKLRYYADSDRLSFNSMALHARMDTLQAALLCDVLEYYPVLKKRRENIFELYRDNLSEQLKQIPQAHGTTVVPYEFPVLTKQRNKLFNYLRANGIPAQLHYATMLHRLEEFPFNMPLPYTEKFNNEILCLPVFPDKDYENATLEAIKIINNFFDN